MFRRLERILSKILMTISMVFICASTVLVFTAAILRYCFGLSYEWIEEVCRYMCVFVGFSMCGYVAFWGKDITLEFLVGMIKNKKVKWALELFNNISAIAIGFLMARWGWTTWARAANVKTFSQIFPMRLPYSLLPIGFCILIVYCVLKLGILLLDKNTDYFTAANNAEEAPEEDAK